MAATRIRVSKGSCWPCKKRRVRCDLTKPVCRRCAAAAGGQAATCCDYNSRLIRWSTPRQQQGDHAPPPAHVHSGSSTVMIPRGDVRLTVSLAVCERQALDYFHARVWPLLSTSKDPCAAPTPVALEHRVVLLAACVLSDSHRRLQDGGGASGGGGSNGNDGLGERRVECLSAVRAEIGGCCVDVDVKGTGSGPLVALLFAVILLHFDDGYVGCTSRTASTSSHHSGVLAILARLGGVCRVLETAPEPLHMLISEFVTTDLTAAVIRGRAPAFPSEVWDVVDAGPVWWSRDPLGRVSLASVFREMAGMSLYLEAVTNTGQQDFDIDRVRAFEAALRPVYAPLTVTGEDAHSDCQSSTSSSDSSSSSWSGDQQLSDAEAEMEAVHAFTLIRAFQHAALLYLYRAVCGLPTRHALVQQHVKSCLGCIFEIPRRAKVLNCVIFPLFLAGCHAVDVGDQEAVMGMADLLYDHMRFASIEAVRGVFRGAWGSAGVDKGWCEVFEGLGPNALVL